MPAVRRTQRLLALRSSCIEFLETRTLFSGPDLQAGAPIPESLAVPYDSREVVTLFATNIGDQPVPAGIDYSLGLTTDPNNPFAGNNFLPQRNGTTTQPVAPGAQLVIPIDPLFFDAADFPAGNYYPVARFAPLADPSQDVDTSNNTFVSHIPILIGVATPPSSLLDGSFDLPQYSFDGNGADVLSPGSINITGWTVVSNQLAVISSNNDFSLTPQDGSDFLDLTSYTDSGTFGGVQQTVTTVPGQTYTVTFYLGSSPRTGDLNPHLLVSAGTQSQEFSNTSTDTSGTIWQKQSFSFNALAATTTITLTGLSAQGNFIGLDNVSVASGAASTPVTLNFDDLTGLGFISFGVPVPSASQLTNQFQSTFGLTFSSAGGFATVVNLGTGHATSGTNAITGSRPDGTLTYDGSFPIHGVFSDPAGSGAPFVTDSLSVRGDNDGTGESVTLRAFDVNGNLLSTSTVPDTGGETLSISTPGIHSFDIIGTSDSVGVGFDDLTFDPATASASTTDTSDLNVTNVTLDQKSYAPGTQGLAVVTVANNGTGASPAPKIGTFYFLSTRTFDLATAIAIGTGTAPILQPGASAGVPVTFTIPASIAPGSYYLAVVGPDGTFGPVTHPAITPTPILVITTASSVIPKTGSLDPSFGNGTGKVTNTITGSPITTVAALTQSDGKLLSAGYDAAGDFTLIRNNSDGSLDTNFGAGGIVRIPFGVGAITTGAVLQSDGRILVAGTALSTTGSDTDFAVTRINTDGSMDSFFATSGKLTLDLATLRKSSNSSDLLRSITLLKSSQILLAGSTGTDNSRDAAVVRLTSSGAVDGSFGDAGLATVDFLGGPDVINALLIQPDNKILILGSASKPDGATFAAVARLTAKGQPDKKFAKNGVFASTVAGDQLTAAAFGLKGAIYLGGFTSRTNPSSPNFTSTPLLIRLTSTGQLDKTFKGGRVTPSAHAAIAAVNSLITTPDGRITASLTTTDSLSNLLAGRLGAVAVRLTTAGAFDPTFDKTGLLSLIAAPSSSSSSIIHASSIVLHALAATTADPALSDAFSALVNDSQGAITSVPGGGIRAIATTADGSDATMQTILAITPDAADLSGTLSGFSAALVAGKPSSVNLTLKNVGSLTAAAAVPVQLFLSTDPTYSTNDFLVGSAKIKTQLNALATAKPVKLTFTPAKTVPAGTYYLVARINPNDTPLKELTIANNDPASAKPARLSSAGKKIARSLFSSTELGFDQG